MHGEEEMSTTTRKYLEVQRLEKALRLRAESDLKKNIICGSAVIVRQEGNIVCEHYFGTTAPDGTEKVSKNTIYRLASMTKPITAVAALILVDRGVLRLDDKVEEYLPQFGNRKIAVFDENGVILETRKVQGAPTIRHILSHSSGIACGENERNIVENLSKEEKLSVKSMVNALSHTFLSFEPFSTQEYSAVGSFDVLTAIIEEVSGKDYETFLQKEVFAPCDMQDTTFVPSTEQTLRLITMHNRVEGRSVVGQTNPGCIFTDFPCTHYLGGAGLVSTLHDYSNFAEMLLNNGCINGKQIISAEMVSEMSTVQVSDNIMPGNQRWGLGVGIITDVSYDTLPVGAYGWSGAYGTHFWVDPINKITAVYMKNSLYDGGSNAATAWHFEMDVANSLI